MKKTVSLVIAGALLMNMSFANFIDVPESHWAYSAIVKMQKDGILNGYEDGTFNPGKNITLSEFSSIFTKIFELPKKENSNYFVEVPESHWAKSSIEGIREYINPYYDSLGESLGFDKYSYMEGITGDLEMTREAFIYAISKIYGYDESQYTMGEEKLIFADYEEILFPKEIVLAYKNGMVKGEIDNGKTYIRPTRYITRAEASTIFRNLLKYEETRIENKYQENELSKAFDIFMADVKKMELDKIKDEIYDTSKILKNEYFTVSEENVNMFKEVIKKYFSRFDYKILETGFNGFNHGYVKVQINGYNIEEELKNISKQVYSTFENESLDGILANFAKEFNNKIKTKEIKKAEFEETFNFIKENGEWKLSLQ